MSSVFYNDLSLLELDKGRWVPITLHVKDSKDSHKRRRKGKETIEENCDVVEENEVVETLEKTKISQSEETEVNTF